jgi:hypothetical protein
MALSGRQARTDVCGSPIEPSGGWRVTLRPARPFDITG